MYLRTSRLALGLVLGSAVMCASPITYTWVSWTSATLSTGISMGTASGSFTIGSTPVTVTYTGDLSSATEVNCGSCVNYYTPTSIYENSTVANLPTTADILTLDENPAYTDTITFSSPVMNPVLDIVSLGYSGGTVYYNFEGGATPVILSQGSAYWGGCSTCLSVSGSSLAGTEGSGVIEFVGTFTSLTFTTTNGEDWNGFTVGVEALGSPSVPEPATWRLCLIATLLAAPIIVWRRRRA